MSAFDTEVLRARQQAAKATWESGDFGRVARFNEPAAAEFLSRIDLRSGLNFLDAACGTGNLAVLAAKAGCSVSGVDIASNLVAQARARAEGAGLFIEYKEGDVESLPYRDAEFDVVASMFGVMFASHPYRVVQELLRVTKPGGLIALASWTPRGFIGKMFDIFKAHLPPASSELPSPLEWGRERVIQERFESARCELRMTRRVARLRYPFPAKETVAFFRQYYGPTMRCFASLAPDAQERLFNDLVRLQSEYNVSQDPRQTDTPAEYLEVHAIVRR